MKYLRREDELLLGKARGGIEPSDADRARIKRKVFAQIGIGVGAATSAVAGSANATAGSAVAGGAGLVAHAGGIGAIGFGMKALAVLAVVGAVGAGVVATSRPPSRALPVSAPVAVSAPVISSQALPRAAASSGATSVVAAAPALTGSEVRVASDHAVEVSPAPGGGALAPSRAVPTPGAGLRASAPSPLGSAQVPALTASAPAPAPSPASVVPTSSVAAEADLLRRADLTLKASDPAGALALLDQHAAQFPLGVLVEERDAERVVVLCALSRVDDARALAATFLRDRPRSPLAQRVRASCAMP